MQINNSTANTSTTYRYIGNTGSLNQDQQIKYLQKQIEDAEKQLQSLSSNKDMSSEMIMENRQKLQQQIQDLNKQLSQRKIEIQNANREEIIIQNDKISSNTSTLEENSISAKTMGNLIGASNNLRLADTPMKVFKEAQNRDDAAAMDRAIGYASNLIQKAKNYAEKAALSMKADTEATKINERLDRESALEYDIKDSKDQYFTTANVETDTVEIGEEGKAALANNTSPNTSMVGAKTKDRPVIYTRAGEAKQSAPEEKLSLQV